jgi:hypothetical protein
MIANDACPPVNQLSRLLVGELPRDLAEALEEHLSRCATCVQKVQTLPSEDTFVEAARQQLESPADQEKGIVQELIDKLQRLQPPAGMPMPATEERSESGAGKDAADRFDFLAPAQQTDEMGRLGGYRILRVLGRGGMGVVFEGEDLRLGRKVAIKAMLPHLAGKHSFRQRFLREARTAAALAHDHIVPIFHVGEEHGAPFIVMPLLRGESLDARLACGEALSMAEVRRVGREIAQGLAVAHAAGLIHRDIKPDNLWLEAPGNRVKILDFGLARVSSEESSLTQQGAIVGTPAYMAPEQVRAGEIDSRCDLFSLGVILYRLATGQPPFNGTDAVSTLMSVATEEPPPPRQINPQIPPALAQLIMKLLRKRPEERYQSAAEVVQALTRIESPTTTTPAPVRGRTRRWLVAAGFLILLALGAGVVVKLQTGRGQITLRTDNPDIEIVTRGNDDIVLIRDKKTKKTWDLDTRHLHLGQADDENGLRIPLDDKSPMVLKRRDGTLLVTIATEDLVEKRPDPVAEKGVLDYAEVHDADQKGFDAWTAQMQKDGYRPVSLSIQVVKDAPRYTAVALKEAKRRLWELTFVEHHFEGPTIEKMLAKNYGAYLQCAHTYGGKYRSAMLWQWNMPRTWMWTGNKSFIDSKTAEAARDANYRPIHRGADDQGRGIVYSAIYGPDDGVPKQDAVDLSLGECRDLIKQYKSDGWMPTNLYAYGAGVKLQFGVTARREKKCPDWDISWSLTPAKYKAQLAARKQLGFRPHSSVGHDDGAGGRFSVIWVRYRSTDAAAEGSGE